MKINSKKQMNLPQLIEWAWDNPELVEGKIYLTKEHDKYSPYVRFSVDGYGVRTSQSISIDDVFTVEVEEEITEYTVIGKLLEVRESGVLLPDYHKKIKDKKTKFTKEFHAYIDGEFKLIWRDGKLVE